MAKHGSATSLDYVPTRCLVKGSLSQNSKGSIPFSKLRERDEALYRHNNQLAQNIALENTREEREKLVRERKRNRYKYRSEL